MDSFFLNQQKYFKYLLCCLQDNGTKLMCWACSCSYKRALAKTKQQDPARHSSVFRKEKSHKSDEERRQEKERKREKYMNSKMPKRPDVTKLDTSIGVPQDTSSHSIHHMSSVYPPPPKVAKRERDDNTDHVGEITQLKEKIAALEKQLNIKDRQLISKDQEITQMKAKVFNEEKLIREKMKQMAKSHEDKVSELQKKTRELQNEISRMRKESRPNTKNKKVENLFKHDKKNSKVSSRTASPLSRSRSRSPRSRSPSKTGSGSASRSQSPVTENTTSGISTTTIVTNDSDGVVVTGLNGNGSHKSPVSPSASPRRSPSRSPSRSSRSRSRSSSPIRRETIAT